MKLVNNLSELITEIAAISDMTSSIKKRNLVTIYYDGNDNGGKGYRTIEPVCLGRMRGTNNLALRAWDEEGASHTGYEGEQPLPGWRLFRLDKILSLKPSNETFTQMRPNFNPNGDKSMQSIIIIAKF